VPLPPTSARALLQVGSLAALLACYLLLLRRRHLPAAAAGAVAVLFRQTNAVWVCFVTAAAVLDDLEELRALAEQLVGLGREEGVRSAELAGQVAGGRDRVLRALAQLRARRRQRHGAAGEGERRDEQERDEQERARPNRDGSGAGGGELAGGGRRRQQLASLTSPCPEGLGPELRQALLLAWHARWQLLRSYWALLLVPLAFAAFVARNGGSITVGDKAAHRPVLHLAQLLYLGLLTALAAPLHFVASGSAPGCCRWCWQRLRRRPLAALAALCLALATALAAIWGTTLEHPYLLADNRHYVFYLWRRVVARHWAARYLLAPAYLYSWWALAEQLRRRHARLWLLVLLACSALTLVPAWLLELRWAAAHAPLHLAPAAPPCAPATTGPSPPPPPPPLAGCRPPARPTLRPPSPHRTLPLHTPPRYFTVPFSLVLLHVPPPAPWRLRATAAAYLAANLAVLYTFVARPFAWPDGSVARFMW
jgi:alpha-1,2-glucosyltransferase